ncbi:MAG: hypothetical protein K9M45_02555 [Kiritimatiellales bacterium]|nr:hypothetical protein [Kiritimatiellales bacterium]
MKVLQKTLILLAGCGIYFVVIRFIAPVHDPAYISGLLLIGMAAWLFGTVPALGFAALLAPLTQLIYNQLNTSYLPVAVSPVYITTQILMAFAIGILKKKDAALRRNERNLENANQKLQLALGRVKELGGLLPICASCKKIRDDTGYWKAVDSYLTDRTKAEFSHGICPECAKTLYGELLGDEYDYDALNTRHSTEWKPPSEPKDPESA